MVDHQSSSSQRQSSQQQPHHSHFQAQHRHSYHQDIYGPRSASVVEGRAFAGFHNHSLLHHPSQSSSSFSSQAVAQSSSTSSSRQNLSVEDILERYQDASKDFLVSVLNAKAKEDERKAEEERHKTEQIKLQAKQLELDLALEKRRGSPPSARVFPAHSSDLASGQYSSSSNAYYGHTYSSYSESRSHPSSTSKHAHHDPIVHTPQEPQDHSQSAHQGLQYSHHDQHLMQPSPQSRPPSLKINTSVRQYHPQPHSSQRLPPSPHSTLPPLPSSNPVKATPGRHYGLPSLSSSAQSSPVAIVDFQSHIPPPLTPKEEHVSPPTSAISPTQSQNMKRKSVNHDAVMDAVRAKVFRNAAGQSQSQSQQQQQQQQQKKTTADSLNGRKSYHEKASPESAKINRSESRQEDRDVKLEGPLISSLSAITSSPGPENRSRSTSPAPSSLNKPRGPTNNSDDETDLQAIESDAR
ncbi:hypothetical protein BGZ46_003305 [Entomortierella lignicola]|nr:hypothetical protein BGZ46_003305 [Entomortierella lignicola]